MNTMHIRHFKTVTKGRGFTLIELMIVVAIVGIIAMVAYPSYQDSVRKSRRVDATGALVEAAAMQERLYSENNSYADNSDLDRLVVNSDGVSSREGYYSLAVDVSECGGPPFNCFSITATAVGPQAADVNCATFTINHRNQKTATSADCW